MKLSEGTRRGPWEGQDLNARDQSVGKKPKSQLQQHESNEETAGG